MQHVTIREIIQNDEEKRLEIKTRKQLYASKVGELWEEWEE